MVTEDKLMKDDVACCANCKYFRTHYYIDTNGKLSVAYGIGHCNFGYITNISRALRKFKEEACEDWEERSYDSSYSLSGMVHCVSNMIDNLQAMEIAVNELRELKAKEIEQSEARNQKPEED